MPVNGIKALNPVYNNMDDGVDAALFL